MNLDRLFDPRGIAVVGASTTPGKLGYEVMKNVAEYDAPAYPVNPSAEGEELFDETVLGSVSDVDGPLDLAMIAVPSPVVPSVLEECGEAGVGAAVIFAGGFAETDDEGEDQQAELVRIADEYDITILGPNTNGFFIPGKDLFGTFIAGIDPVEEDNVAVISQSGGVGHELSVLATNEGRGVSAMVGLGNRANLGFEETIAYFDEDPNTDAIVLYIEGVSDARGLLKACEAADTPIAAYKAGREDVGEFAESHTGALTGSYELYQGGFTQHGVVSVDSIMELFDVGAALADCPTPEGEKAAIVTAQAGPGIIIADRLKRIDGTLSELSQETQEDVAELLPGITFTENPVDTGRPSPEFGEIVEVVAHDDDVDVLIVFELHEIGLGYPIEEFRRILADVDVPVVFGTGGIDHIMEDDLQAVRDEGIPTYTTPERTADAACALVRRSRMANRGEDE